MKIPSISAARMIDRTKIGVAAPGLRPVASAALEPRMPMPIAAPIAAIATWKNGSVIVLVLCCLFLKIPTVRLWSDFGNWFVMCLMFFAVIADQLEKNRAKEGEYERLDKANQQLHKIEGEGWHEREIFLEATGN
jgi:hypothetical protein